MSFYVREREVFGGRVTDIHRAVAKCRCLYQALVRPEHSALPARHHQNTDGENKGNSEIKIHRDVAAIP